MSRLIALSAILMLASAVPTQSCDGNKETRTVLRVGEFEISARDFKANADGSRIPTLSFKGNNVAIRLDGTSATADHVQFIRTACCQQIQMNGHCKWTDGDFTFV